jgi:thiol-disulfide isomerase/thioredoxin
MKLLFIFLFVPIVLNAQTKNKSEFIINGKVNYTSDRYIYFVWYNADEQRFLDSIKVIKGSFVYKGISNGYIDRFYIKSDYNNKLNNDSLNNVNVPIDNSVMSLELKVGQFSKYKLKGCKSCDLLRIQDEQYKVHHQLSERYHRIIDDSMINKSKREKYEILDETNWNQLQNKITKWCKKNPSNNLTPFYIFGWKNSFGDAKMESMFIAMSEFQKNSFFGLALKKIIDENFLIKNQVGTMAVNFERSGYDSLAVNLKNINKNSYVLLDFWASWCIPCRASHPDLIRIFKKYRPSNFNVIGIAADDDVAKWKNAIKADSVFIWYHILGGYKSGIRNNAEDLCEKYHIRFYPAKILIDDKGKIIGRYNIPELEKKLKEIYKY